MDPKRNPEWVKNGKPAWAADWPYEEDWDSPAWRERMRQDYAELAERRARDGFIECPRCGETHTAKTLTCRTCGYQGTEKD